MFRKSILVAALGFILLGIVRVRMDVQILDLLPQSLPEVEGLQEFLIHFSKEDELLIALESSDANLLDEAVASLTRHLQSASPPPGHCTSESLWGASTPPGELGELLAWLILNGTPTESFPYLVEGLRPDRRDAVLEDSLDTIGASMEIDEALTLAYDPYQLAQRFREAQPGLFSQGGDHASDDGSLRLIYLQAPAEALTDYQQTILWVERVRALTTEWQADFLNGSELQIGFTGEPVFRAEISSSMEHDMKFSAVTALVLTSLIFAVAYRRVRPLLALVAGLSLTFLLTLGIAGWLIDAMTVMSVGFASILIGLSVDYGVLLYQHSLENEGTPPEPQALRRRSRRSIIWAALTTATAFAALGMSVVPGIATLGQLVAIGILVGAVVMLWIFPLLLGRAAQSARARQPLRVPLGSRSAGIVFAMMAFLALSPFWKGWPALDTSSEALRPRGSSAYATMDRLEDKMRGQASNQVAILALNENPVGQLEQVEAALTRAAAADPGANYFVPRVLVPHPENQQGNLDQLTSEQLDLEALQDTAEAAGFEPEALQLTEAVVQCWNAWHLEGLPNLPASGAARRFWEQVLAMDPETERPTNALISYRPTAAESAGFDLASVVHEVDESALPVSWPAVSTRLNERVPADLRVVGGGLALAVIIMLILTFRRPLAVGLSLGVTALTLLALCGTMRWLGWEWNFFSLGALLLTLGAGLDYSIHILLDHRRHEGDLTKLRAGVLRALTVCSLSTIAGFASISYASNQGLASLGKVCALALALNALVALVVLPWLLEKLPRRHLL